MEWHEWILWIISVIAFILSIGKWIYDYSQNRPRLIIKMENMNSIVIHNSSNQLFTLNNVHIWKNSSLLNKGISYQIFPAKDDSSITYYVDERNESLSLLNPNTKLRIDYLSNKCIAFIENHKELYILQVKLETNDGEQFKSKKLFIDYSQSISEYKFVFQTKKRDIKMK